jgi:hypothetical protein
LDRARGTAEVTPPVTFYSYRHGRYERALLPPKSAPPRA